MTWSEDEYVEYLAMERRHFAWVLRHHGDATPAEADAAALEHYPYEPADAPNRGLVFHDESWHWAMLTIHGSCYWIERPELAQPSAEYEALE